MITTLLEMCFADVNLGAVLDFSDFDEKDPIKILFSENCGIVFQASIDEDVQSKLITNNITTPNALPTSTAA